MLAARMYAKMESGGPKKKVLNKDLVEELGNLVKLRSVCFEHVLKKSKVPGNIEADALARKATARHAKLVSQEK